ncbi:MAG: hypothetical protein PHO27_03815 [Sulfuricurvum sp.]|nr:hypothetical protein [Sulfuricurvum sp.]
MKRLAYLRNTRSGKIILTLLGIVFLFYLVLFTPWGNRLMTPLLEKSLSSTFATPISVQEFSLRHNRFHLIAQDSLGNTLSTQGGFSLLTLRLYAHYRLECFQKGGMNPITVSFKTNGALSGGIAAFNIHGNMDIFGGNVLYQIELHRFHLAQIQLQLANIAYEPILHILDYPSNTNTILTGAVTLKGFDLRDVEGDIHISSETRRFVPTPIMEDDNTSFDLKALLADKYGRVKPFHTNITIEASLAHAGILEQFIGLHVGGGLKLNASLRGNEKLLYLETRTGVANSDTSLTLTMDDLELSSVKFSLKHADLEPTFVLFALPAPIAGITDAYGEFNSTGGKLDLSITKGMTIPSTLLKEYNITQPLIRFNALLKADIGKKGIHYHGSFKSNLSRLNIDNTTTHEQMLSELLKNLH